MCVVLCVRTQRNHVHSRFNRLDFENDHRRRCPRLDFSGPKLAVEDRTEHVDACRYEEHAPPRVDRLLYSSTIIYLRNRR